MDDFVFEVLPSLKPTETRDDIRTRYLITDHGLPTSHYNRFMYVCTFNPELIGPSY